MTSTENKAKTQNVLKPAGEENWKCCDDTLKGEKKTREKFLFTAHQDMLIQSVENNLTIIFVKDWRFFVESEQSYRSFRVFPQSAVSLQNVKNNLI